MSARLQSKAVAPRRKRTEVVVLEDDRWVWGAIFTVVAGEHVIAVALWIALIQLARRAR